MHQLKDDDFSLRLLAVFCITAGIARAITSFIPWESGRLDLEILAFFIDVGTLLGLVAFYCVFHARLGWFGFIGWAIAVSGIALISGPDGRFFDVDIYGLGIAFISAGLAVLSLSLLRIKFSLISAVCWLSLLPTNVLISYLGFSEVAFTVAGILYGAGFATLGWNLRRRTDGGVS